MMTLNAYLAHAGVCSRRKAAELVKAGAVTVNGNCVTEPAYRVRTIDVIKANNKVIYQESKVYILLNKPRNCVTTVADDKGRVTVMDIVQGAPNARLYPVGRLDRGTTGLLLLTNDGALAQQLAHPSNHVSKIYQVSLNAALTQFDLTKIRRGISLEDGVIVPDDVDHVVGQPSKVLIELHSGQNRVVRRIFEHLGYTVKRLDRIGYAGLTKKNLLCGSWRYLTDREVSALTRFGFVKR